MSGQEASIKTDAVEEFHPIEKPSFNKTHKIQPEYKESSIRLVWRKDTKGDLENISKILRIPKRKRSASPNITKTNTHQSVLSENFDPLATRRTSSRDSLDQLDLEYENERSIQGFKRAVKIVPNNMPSVKKLKYIFEDKNKSVTLEDKNTGKKVISKESLEQVSIKEGKVSYRKSLSVLEETPPPRKPLRKAKSLGNIDEKDIPTHSTPKETFVKAATSVKKLKQFFERSFSTSFLNSGFNETKMEESKGVITEYSSSPDLTLKMEPFNDSEVFNSSELDQTKFETSPSPKIATISSVIQLKEKWEKFARERVQKRERKSIGQEEKQEKNIVVVTPGNNIKKENKSNKGYTKIDRIEFEENTPQRRPLERTSVRKITKLFESTRKFSETKTSPTSIGSPSFVGNRELKAKEIIQNETSGQLNSDESLPEMSESISKELKTENNKPLAEIGRLASVKLLLTKFESFNKNNSKESSNKAIPTASQKNKPKVVPDLVSYIEEEKFSQCEDTSFTKHKYKEFSDTRARSESAPCLESKKLLKEDASKPSEEILFEDVVEPLKKENVGNLLSETLTEEVKSSPVKPPTKEIVTTAFPAIVLNENNVNSSTTVSDINNLTLENVKKWKIATKKDLQDDIPGTPTPTPTPETSDHEEDLKEPIETRVARSFSNSSALSNTRSKVRKLKADEIKLFYSSSFSTRRYGSKTSSVPRDRSSSVASSTPSSVVDQGESLKSQISSNTKYRKLHPDEMKYFANFSPNPNGKRKSDESNPLQLTLTSARKEAQLHYDEKE